jgi:hypothetical protein
MDDKAWQSVMAAAKDRQGLPPNIPYDAADPYIFHSITRPVTEEVVNTLLKNNAGLVNIDEVEYGVDPAAQRAAAAWQKSGVRGRGQVEEIDEQAGDAAYIFMTPGYVFNSKFATFAFRLSTLLKGGRGVRFRVTDLQAVYLKADQQVGYPLLGDYKPYTDWDKIGDLANIAAAGTLSAADSPDVIREFVQVRIGKAGAYSGRTHEIVEQKISEANGIRFGEHVAKMWRDFLNEPFSENRGGENRPEVLLTGILPLKAAASYRLTANADWQILKGK